MTAQTDNLILELTESSGNEFFDILGQHLNVKIPKTVKNILTFNHYDTIFTLSEFNNDSINEIQDCMRDVFEEAMLEDGEQLSDYLGKFVKVQKKFIIVSGELRIIEKMAKTCQSLYVHQPERDSPPGETPSTQQDENELESDTSDIRSIFRTWLPAQENLIQIVTEEELELNITFRHKQNGVRSYYMKCPVVNCNHKYVIFHKGYPQNYKPKKVKTTPPKIGKDPNEDREGLPTSENNPTEEPNEDREGLPQSENNPTRDPTSEVPSQTDSIEVTSQTPSTTNLGKEPALANSRDGEIPRNQVRRRKRSTLDEVNVIPPKRTKRVAKTLTQHRRQPVRGQNRQ